MSQSSEQEWNVYTALVMLSCGALLTGCVLLYLELGKYGFAS